jgi:hypothetical protein
VSAPLTIDTTPPVISGFRCSQYLSFRRLVLTCDWDINNDDESGVTGSVIALGTQPEDVSDWGSCSTVVCKSVTCVYNYL